jgi:hypothetical protein
MQKKENVLYSFTQSNSMNFVLWFMGTKQDPNGTIKKVHAKIQVITSVCSNRLLIKAFFKEKQQMVCWFLVKFILRIKTPI